MGSTLDYFSNKVSREKGGRNQKQVTQNAGKSHAVNNSTNTEPKAVSTSTLDFFRREAGVPASKSASSAAVQHNTPGAAAQQGSLSTLETTERPEKYTEENILRYRDRAEALANLPSWTDEQRAEAEEIYAALGMKENFFTAPGKWWKNTMYGITRDGEKYTPSLAHRVSGGDLYDEWGDIVAKLSFKTKPGVTAVYSGLTAGTGAFSIAEAIANGIGKVSSNADVAAGAEETMALFREMDSYGKQAAPALYGAANVAGTLALAYEVGSALSGGAAALEGGITIGGTTTAIKASPIVTRMATNALTFAATDAIHNIGAVSSGQMSSDDYFQSIGISAAGGLAGGLAEGLTSTGIATILKNKGLMTPFGEFVRATTSATASSWANIGTNYALSEEKPSNNELAIQLTTAFALSLLQSSISTYKTTNINKGKMEAAIEKLQRDYSYLSQNWQNMSPAERAQQADAIITYTQNARNSLNSYYMAGQQNTVDAMNGALDTIEAAMQQYVTGFTNASVEVPGNLLPGGGTAMTTTGQAAQDAEVQQIITSAVEQGLAVTGNHSQSVDSTSLPAVDGGILPAAGAMVADGIAPDGQDMTPTIAPETNPTDIKAELVNAGATEAEAETLAPLLTSVLSGEEISGNQAGVIAKNEAAVSILKNATGEEINTDAPLGEVKAAIRGLASRQSAQTEAAATEGTTAQVRPVETVPDPAQSAAVTGRENVQEFAATLGKAGEKVFNDMYDEGQDAVSYVDAMMKAYNAGKNGGSLDNISSQTVTAPQFQAAYEAGKAGLPRERANLVSDIQEQAFLAGQQDRVLNMGQNTVDNQNSEPLASAADTQYTNNKNMEVLQNGGKIHLRNGGQWTDSANPGGTVFTVENRTRGNQGRQAKGRSADGEAAGLTYGKKVSTAEAGITGGFGNDAIYLVVGGDTKATIAAKEEAAVRGLKLVLFGGGDIHTEDFPEGARGYVDGKTMYVRVDDPDYTADQIARHEGGHDRIRKGEINPETVRDRLVETIGEDAVNTAAELYALAYAGSDMTPGEVWVECICDSLGDMNIFSGVNTMKSAGGFVGEYISQVKQKAQETAKASRAPPSTAAGKASRRSLIGGNFPPYNISKSMTNTESTRWAHRDDVKEGDQLLVSYHGAWYLIEKDDSNDLLYQIVEKVPAKKYEEYAKEIKEYGRTGQKESTAERIGRIDRVYGGGSAHDGAESGASAVQTEHRGKNLAVQRLVENQTEGRKTAGNRDGNYEGSSENLKRAGKGDNSVRISKDELTERLKESVENVAREGQIAAEEVSRMADSYLQAELEKLRQVHGTIKPGENAARKANVPKKTADGRKVSQTVRTILEAKATPEAAVPTIEEMVAKGELSYDSLSDKKAREKAEKKFEDGWERAVDSWLGQVKKGKVSKELTAEGWVLYNNAVNKANAAADPQTKKQAMSIAMDVLQAMVGHQRNAAQALQATRILKNLNPETRLYGVQRSIASLQRELNERYGDEKAPKLRISQELGEAFLAAQTEEERTSALKEIYRDVGRQLPARFKEKWNAWRYLAMLGNPRTHVRNILGNALFAPVVAAKDLTATGIEALAARISGGETGRTKAFVSLGKADRGLLKAAWNDFAHVQETFSDSSKYADPARMGRKHIEEGRVIFQKGAVTKAAEKLSGRTFQNGILENLRRGNSNLLEKEDAWFSQPHYALALAQYCKANGITAEMLQGQKNTAENGGKMNGIKPYSRHQIDNWSSSKKIVIFNGLDSLLSFVKDARAKKNLEKKLYFGTIDKDLAEYVLNETGVDIYGRNVTLRAGNIPKIFKSHGTEKTEGPRGQRPIVEEDFSVIPDVVGMPDHVVRSEKDYDGKPVLEFSKLVDGSKVTVVAVDSGGSLDLFVQTMYAGAKKGSIANVTNAKALIITPETSVGTAPTTSIPKTAEKSNSDLTAKLDAARAYAIQEALKATYRDTNVLSEFLSRRASEKKWSGKATNTIMDGILPFRKTPANILARGVEYSPLGLLWGVKQAVWDVRRGEKTAAEAIDSISAGLTGTMLLGLGIWAAAQGLIRGHGGEDEEKKEFEELMGHQAYSLEADGTSVTLDWLAPEVLPLFIGVNLWELGKKDELTLSEVLTSVGTVTEPLLEMSCLQSLNDLLESVGGAAASDTAPLVAVLASAATSYLTQAVPTLFGQIERLGEGQRMTTYTNKNAFLTTDMQYMLGKISQKMPWDYQQIPYIDAWGRAEDTGNVVTKTFNNFLNPAYTSEIDTSTMELELLRLYDETGESSIFPSRADKYFTVDGQRKNLTAEEYVQYATLKGRTAYELLTDLLSSTQYRAMSDAEKVEAIEDAYDMANQQAKAAVSGFETDGWMRKAQEAEQKYGVPVETYIILRSQTAGIVSLKDAKGETIDNSKGLQIMQIVYDTPGLTEKQRNALFEYLGVGKTIRNWNKTRVNEALAKMKKAG